VNNIEKDKNRVSCFDAESSNWNTTRTQGFAQSCRFR
jgi:hypothetical protein